MIKKQVQKELPAKILSLLITAVIMSSVFTWIGTIANADDYVSVSDSVYGDDTFPGFPGSGGLPDDSSSSDDSYEVTDFSCISITPGKDAAELNFAWYSVIDSVYNQESSIVQIAKKSQMTNDEFPVDKAITFLGTITDISDTVSNAYSNKVTVAGLEESTQYVYRLGDGGNENWSEVYNFNTYETNQFSFLFVADPQIGASHDTESDLEDWESTVSQAVYKFPEVSMIVSAGDQVEKSSNESQYTAYFSPEALKSLPVAPVVGNHDNSVNFTYHFNVPNEITQYGSTDAGGDYYFTYGRTLFMMLNSNVTSGTDHKAFMEEAIAANPDAAWKVVVFHHSIYSAASHSTDDFTLELRSNLSPVFDELGIDVALMGHDHCYVRSYQILNDLPQKDQTYNEYKNVVNPTGTLYITGNSASGSKYYNLKAAGEEYSAVRSQLEVPSFSHVSVNNYSFNITTYRTDTMEEIDTYTIVKPADITGVKSKNSIKVYRGKDFDELNLPEEVEVILNNGETETLPVQWNSGNFNGNATGTYTLYGTLDLVTGLTNTSGLQAEITVTVKKRSSSSNNSNHTTVSETSITGDKITVNLTSALENNNTKVKASINSKTLQGALSQAKQDKNGHKVIKIMTAEVQGVKEYTLEMASRILSSSGTNNRFEIETAVGTMVVPENMFRGYDIGQTKNVELSIKQIDKSDLNTELNEILGDKPVIELNVKLDGEVVKWDNPDAPVTISIDYTPTSEELKDVEHIVVWYIDNQRKIISIPNGKYNVASGKVTFTTTHFSKYAVAFVKKTFNDISSFPWAQKQIEVLASKGVINGTSSTSFNPSANITRADFASLLVRALELNANFNSNFSDVTSKDYYYNALGVAKALGIANGVDNNKFNPEEQISRQDMMVLASKALELTKNVNIIGSISDLKKFDDYSEISSYAAEGVAALVQEGIVVGSNNIINPKATATRAEAVVMIYRLLTYNL